MWREFLFFLIRDRFVVRDRALLDSIMTDAVDHTTLDKAEAVVNHFMILSDLTIQNVLVLLAVVTYGTIYDFDCVPCQIKSKCMFSMWSKRWPILCTLC